MTWCQVWYLFALNIFVIFIFLELPPPPPPHITLVLGLSRNPGELVYPHGLKTAGRLNYAYWGYLAPDHSRVTLIGRTQPQAILELRLLGRNLNTFNVIGRIGVLMRVHKFLSSSVRNHQVSLKSTSSIEFQYLLNIYRAGRNLFESRIVIFIRKLNI